MTYLRTADKFMANLDVPEVYRVGGSVRDEILGRKPKDGDYVVRGVDLKMLGPILKREARKIDPKATVTKLELRTGQHGGWRAAVAGIGTLEVMLPRIDVKHDRTDFHEVGNTRHSFEITVDPSITLEEDALRRDFTMNALYRDLRTGEVIDPLDGRHDIHDELIRVTHDDSFRDDPLRILRAVRFQAVLGFDVEHVTRLTMIEHASAVTGLTGKGVSGTAVDEFFKMLMGDRVADALRTMRDTGVLAHFIPELAPMIGHDPQNSHHSFATDEHTFVAIEAAARLGLPLRVRLALLFHDSGKPEVEWVGDDGMKHYYESKAVPGSEDHAYASERRFIAFAARLQLPKDLVRDVPILIVKHMVPLTMKIKPTKVRKWRVEIGDDLLADLLKHRLCDVMGKGEVNYDDLRAIARMEGIREDAIRDGIPASAKDMKDMGLINGHDLIEMGVPSAKIGDVLAAVLHEIVSNPDRMDREWMLGRAEKLARKV
jgi:tRNA nucleotidyltransferase (CCA-adding enzyme)